MRSRAEGVALALLAACSKGPCPFDGALDKEQCAAVQALVLPDALPAARGNHHAGDRGAAVLGFHVFFDARFSQNQTMRCASCHQPEESFSDARSVPPVGHVPRRTPSLVNAAWLDIFLWDGGADTVWSQPIIPLENPAEMGFTRLEVAHALYSYLRAEYEAPFGAMPDLSDTARFPPAGKPGDPAYDGMAPADRDAVDRIAANLGKAFEAYVRKLAAGRSAFDRYALGDASALTASQRRGLRAFLSAGCLDCHGGPLFTDQGFHNLGIAAAAGQEADPGRARGAVTLAASRFNLLGPFSDDPPPADQSAYSAGPGALGAFRTPSLRNVAIAAPYGHNGAFATLRDVLDFHLAGGGRGGTRFVGDVDPLLVPRQMSDGDRDALVDFLAALTGQYPAPPWNNWPQN